MADRAFFNGKINTVPEEAPAVMESKEEKKSVRKSSDGCICDRSMGVTKVAGDLICNKCKLSVGKIWPHPVSGTGPYVKQ
jgi:hypothetical protein